jgi:hypothetical protein
MLYRPKAYKHPVLAYFTADYLAGPRFECEISFADGMESLEAQFVLESDYLNTLLADGKARFGLELLCTETITRKFFWLERSKSEISLAGLDLYGQIEIAPLVVAAVSFDDFEPTFINPEYSQRVFSVKVNEPLAIGPVFVGEIGRDHRRSEKPLQVEIKSGKPAHWFDLDTEQEVLKLLVSEDIGKGLQLAERDPHLKPLLSQGIYLNTVSIAIEKMQKKLQDNDQSQFWVRRLLSSLQQKGVDPDGDPLLMASELLYPESWKKIIDRSEED